MLSGSISTHPDTHGAIVAAPSSLLEIDSPLPALTALRAREISSLQLEQLRPLESQGLVAIVPSRALEWRDIREIVGALIDEVIYSRTYEVALCRNVRPLGRLIVGRPETVLHSEIAQLRGVRERLSDYPASHDDYCIVGPAAVAITARGRRALGEVVLDRDHGERALDLNSSEAIAARGIWQTLHGELTKIIGELTAAEAAAWNFGLKGVTRLAQAIEQTTLRLGILRHNILACPNLFGDANYLTDLPKAMAPLESTLTNFGSDLERIALSRKGELATMRAIGIATANLSADYDLAEEKLSGFWVAVGGARYEEAPG